MVIFWQVKRVLRCFSGLALTRGIRHLNVLLSTYFESLSSGPVPPGNHVDRRVCSSQAQLVYTT